MANMCRVFRDSWLFFRCALVEQAGVEACLILGELKMGTDALLAAILSGVLRPSAQPMEFGRAAVTADDIEQVSLFGAGACFVANAHRERLVRVSRWPIQLLPVSRGLIFLDCICGIYTASFALCT